MTSRCVGPRLISWWRFNVQDEASGPGRCAARHSLGFGQSQDRDTSIRRWTLLQFSCEIPPQGKVLACLGHDVHSCLDGIDRALWILGRYGHFENFLGVVIKSLCTCLSVSDIA